MFRIFRILSKLCKGVTYFKVKFEKRPWQNYVKNGFLNFAQNSALGRIQTHLGFEKLNKATLALGLNLFIILTTYQSEIDTKKYLNLLTRRIKKRLKTYQI